MIRDLTLRECHLVGGVPQRGCHAEPFGKAQGRLREASRRCSDFGHEILDWRLTMTPRRVRHVEVMLTQL
jgi:hypothetical protein